MLAGTTTMLVQTTTMLATSANMLVKTTETLVTTSPWAFDLLCFGTPHSRGAGGWFGGAEMLVETTKS